LITLLSLALTTALNVTGPLGNFLPWLGVTEEKFRAVERIRLISENLDDERNEIIYKEQINVDENANLENSNIDKISNEKISLIKSDDGSFSENNFSLVFEDVYLKYDNETKYVLNNISFKVPYGKKIGIIGR
jgi:ABC-type multidrug transport system fused ATPase/permease subunit